MIALAAVFINIYQPANQNEKKISVPVVKEIVDAKPLVPKSKNEFDKKNNQILTVPKKNVQKNKIFILETIRVSPEGGLVVAGKVFPNSEVHIISKGEIIAKTVSDKTGEFVIVPKKLLKAGEHILVFKVTKPNNNIIIADQAIAVKLKEDLSEIPIVALINSESKIGTKIIQGPGKILSNEKMKIKNKISKLPDNLKPEISILTLTNDLNLKQINLTGYAIGGIQVDARISGKEVFSDKIIDNEWAVTLPNQLIIGKQKLSVSLIDKKGKIIAEDHLDLFGNEIKDSEGKTLIVVQKGDALWKIAYKRLGGGDKYLEIFNLNKNKIENPNLIFPKQLFILPN